ncbi:hypothetical protein ACP70R_004197 [Stipagrostis hirtigluma subsp. patula]
MANHHVSVLTAALLLSTIASTTTALTNTTSTTIASANATVASPAISLANSGKPTVYDVLKQYGFPPGLLPTGATGYNLRPDGSFEAYLAAECNFRIHKWSVRFSNRIAGNIQTGSIHNLEGVKVKVLFVWIRINQVDHAGDQLHLHAGPVTKSFSVSDFTTSPHCS